MYDIEDFFIEDDPYDSKEERENKIIKLLKKAEFFVEATSTESFFLWKENDRNKWVKWEQVRILYPIVVGNIKGKDVLLHVGMAKLDGHSVCFYEYGGYYICPNMCEDWLQKRFQPKWDNGTRLAYTNAMNFHFCVSHCRGER